MKESKSRAENVAGFYDLKANQTTEWGLNGYKNEWSSHERLGHLSTDLSHSVGVNKHGAHFTDKVSNSALGSFTAPAVLLGGSNPYFESHNQKPSVQKNSHNSGTYTSSSVTPSPKSTHFSGGVSSYKQGYDSPIRKSTIIDDNTSSCCLPGNCLSSFFGFRRKPEKPKDENNKYLEMNF